ncbi:hypothetical protein GCM10010994_60870 [Chelatococcus reniformis]|uniref:Uncharacterized protein n=1 Tax=Chelatococcus reniformis TaxID=1494448 RepID=A0A916XQ52_9HYPH|nr:hypothetical protein GCM10010994_60870 [Chelatococcus reniformis]
MLEPESDVGASIIGGLAGMTIFFIVYANWGPEDIQLVGFPALVALFLISAVAGRCVHLVALAWFRR